MTDGEILTHERSILLGLGFFIRNFLLFCLVGARPLDHNILVFDNPGQIVHTANDVQGFLPSLLGDIQTRLALDFGSKDNIDLRHLGNRVEHGVETHVDKTEIIQFRIGGFHRTFGGSSDRYTYRQEKNSQYFCHIFHF